MEVETTIAAGIRTTSEESKYDAVCKELLSEKIILAWILKSCLDEFQDYGVSEIAERYIEGEPVISQEPVMPNQSSSKIRGISQEDSSLTEHTVTYDILFRAIRPTTGDAIQLIINVEAQSNYYVGYPLIKRGIYYSSRLISSQYGREFTHSHYEKIQKVYSIWICTDPPQKRQNTITRYEMMEHCLVGNTHETKKDYDLQSVVMIYLGDKQGKNYKGLLKLLGTLLSTEDTPMEKMRVLSDEFHIPMTETLEGEVSTMCNLSQGVAAKAMDKGIKQGVLLSIQNLMESMGWSVEEAMAALRIPDEEKPDYAAQIINQ